MAKKALRKPNHGTGDEAAPSATQASDRPVRRVIRLDFLVVLSLILGYPAGIAAILFLNQTGASISLRWAVLGAVPLFLLGFWKYDEFKIIGRSIGDFRMTERASKRFLQGYGLALAVYLGVTMAWILVDGFGYQALGTLALAIFTGYYLLRLIDSQSVLARPRIISLIPAALLLALAVLPPLSLLVPSIASAVILQVGVYFPTLFFLFGLSSLALYFDSSELKLNHPGAWVEIGNAGFYNVAVAYLFIGNDAIGTIVHPSSPQEQLVYLPILVMAFLGYLLYSRPWFSRRKWLESTKEGRKLKERASKDNWLEKAATTSRFTHAIGEVVFFLSVTATYIGIVLLYETAAAPATTTLLFGLLMLGSSVSMVSYGLRRTGLPFKARDLARFVASRELPDADALKKRLNVQISLFAGTLGVLLTLAIATSSGSLLAAQSHRATYTYLLYSELFMVLMLIVTDSYLRFQALDLDGEEPSPQLAASVKRMTEWSFRWWFIMWGGITGSIAVALGIPLYIDAPIVVGTLLASVIIQTYILWIRAKDRRWKAQKSRAPAKTRPLVAPITD